MSCKKYVRLIETYVDGAATADERRAVETHVAECSPCAGSLKTSQRLASMLQAASERKVDGGFEARLFAAITEREPEPSRAAWWERFRLLFEWRYRMPGLVMASGLAAAVICGVIAPPIVQNEAGKREVMAATVQQHKQLSAQPDVSPDAVDATIELLSGPDVIN